MTSCIRRVILALCAILSLAVPAAASLNIETITWNVIGLDSNDPLNGPTHFPVGARVCSDVATTNVSVDFFWDSANADIDLRSGSLSTITIPSIGAGGCADAYFEVEVSQNPSAFDTTRAYHITATDVSGTVSTPTPRELYVEHLISQSRNAISDVKYGPDPLSLTSVPPGGSMALVVGNTYTIQLIGGTATQGYEQFEAFINFTNTVFRIVSVETTYSANTSPYVTGPAPAIHDQLYADACLWENDPNSPNYRACVGGDFKSGGSNVVTTYTIEIIGGGGTSETLTTLLYDFSGSSFHYNADFGTGARIANIIDPTTATIGKSFAPNPAVLDGVSVLTFTLSNPNGAPLSGFNFVDNLPANLEIAATPGVTTSGCGTPSVTAVAGGTSISFSNGTVAANGTCSVSVNITPTATGAFLNTTNNLFIDTTDTGDNASDTLNVGTETPGTGICGFTLAAWTFPTGFSFTSPAPTTDNVTGTPSAAPGDGVNEDDFTEGTDSWGSNGGITTGGALVTANEDYLEFAVDTTGFMDLELAFDAARKNTPNSPQGIAVYAGTSSLTRDNVAGNGPASDPGTEVYTPNSGALPTGTTAFTSFGPLSLPDGTTHVRIYFFAAGNTNSGSDVFVDNVTFTGCAIPTDPTMTKSFSPDPIAVNGTSTLTFTLTNTNTTALTGAAFSDSLPAGLEVASTPNASTTCGGTWTPTAGATTLTFSAGTIPGSGSCTVSVDVTATTAGPHTNVAGFLSTTESGEATDSIATDTLTAVLPPEIAKKFSPDPIIPNGISTLTFLITNPNVDNALSGVAFSDTFPNIPAQMVVAAIPNASTSGCGAPAFAPSAGASSVAFSGGTITGGGTCIVTVDVTAPATGAYENLTDPVSHVINAQTIDGNMASDTLDVNAPNPDIHVLKQVGPSATGPWTSYLAVPVGADVFYKFTIENTGDVPLSPVSISDNMVDLTGCNAGLPATLEVADALDDQHLATCMVGPVTAVSGTNPNTAIATGTYSGNPVNSNESEAIYATTAITLDKTAVQASFTSAGDTLNYNYLVTNTGAATLDGPVTVTDDKATVTCPALTTVGDLDNFFDPAEAVTCTASYNVTAGDVAAGFVTNTATASAGGIDSNSDSVTVFSTTAVDVSLVKTLTTPGPWAAGDSVTYTILVANAGPATATGIDVVDTPTNLTINSVTSTNCSGFPCTIPSLAMNASELITVTATIIAAGNFDNAATATPDQSDTNPSNNTDNDGDTATASADVSIVKTLTTAGPYLAGQSISYTLDIENAGPSIATNIVVTDAPSNLTLTGITGACSTLPFPCTIPTLGVGASAQIVVNATINAAGAFDNVATANADEPDPDSLNNTDNAGNNGTADPAADISVVKTLTTTGPYTVGQPVTYTLDVANGGPSVANNIQVTDTPSNLTITNVSGSGCASLPCSIASLGVGASTQILVTATIDAVGAFDNAATVDADEADPDTSDNTDDDGNGGTTEPSANVSIVKTLVTAPPYVVGQTISYTLTIANAGPSTANNIDVTDTPTNLTNVGVSGACASLPCTIASLAMNANAVINVTATIAAEGAFDNVATANADEPDPDTDDNTDDSGNGGNAGPSADISIVKTLTTAGPFIVGQSITYTLDVANGGPSTANNVQVTDTPTNLTVTNVTGCAPGGSFPCSIASLASGAGTQIIVTATINAAGAFDNAATVDADEPDPDTTDNTDDDGNNGVTGASADVSIVKTLVTSPPFVAGQTIAYTLTIANAGPSTANNIDVTDTPTNLTNMNVSGACATLPCTIASLAMNANTVINVTATITAAGAFDNVATANADEPDPDAEDNTDDTENGGNAGPSADVSIVKTLTTAGPYVAGQSISYTLDVANAGPSTATNIDVTDTPTNLTITNVSGACASLPCTIASLASGASTQIIVTATIDAAGAFDNVATVAADEPDPDTTDNTDDDGNNGVTGPSADVSIVKTLVTPGPYSVGQSISYTLDVANAGPSTATNIDVTDTPANLTITSVSGACAALPCTIINLISGVTTTIDVTATIDAIGAFDNVATANADEPDPDPTDDTDDDENGGTAGPSADISIVKTLTTAAPYSAGQAVSYTLTVANAGPSTANNIQVTDTATNLTITNVSGACASLPCTIATLASGANTVINVTATIDGEGAFDNAATVDADEPDPDTTDNTDDDGNNGSTTPSADISIAKTLITAGPYSAGQSIDYSLLIANAGPSTANNIDVTDTPTNLTITSVSGACASLPCTIASLASGANTTINVAATIDASGAFDNAATANADEPDPDPTDNTDDDGNNGITGASADISIVKTLTTAPPYSLGQSITYSLLVSNDGPSTATNIEVTDTPTNLTITGVSGSGCTAFPCTIPSLAASASTSITVTATINAGGAFDNAATVTADEPDPDPDDNTDDDGNGGSTPDVDLQITKTVSSPEVEVGETFTFTLVIVNNGPDTATGVVVTDPLPANFQLASAASTQGTCTGTTTVTCTLGTMLDGATVTITITGHATAEGVLMNTATVDANETEAVTSNNESSAGPLASHAPGHAIPTASEWGLILLAMMLAVLAITKMR